MVAVHLLVHMLVDSHRPICINARQLTMNTTTSFGLDFASPGFGVDFTSTVYWARLCVTQICCRVCMMILQVFFVYSMLGCSFFSFFRITHSAYTMGSADLRKTFVGHTNA